MISIVTFISYMWSISLSIKLRNFDMVNIQRYIEDYKIAAKVSKAGLIMELVMVCTVSVAQPCIQCSIACIYSLMHYIDTETSSHLGDQ